jgi:hypothetical protein
VAASPDVGILGGRVSVHPTHVSKTTDDGLIIVLLGTSAASGPKTANLAVQRRIR